MWVICLSQKHIDAPMTTKVRRTVSCFRKAPLTMLERASGSSRRSRRARAAAAIKPYFFWMVT